LLARAKACQGEAEDLLRRFDAAEAIRKYSAAILFLELRRPEMRRDTAHNNNDDPVVQMIADLYVSRAACRLLLAQHEEAAVDASTALRYNPEDTQAMCRMAQALSELGFHVESLKKLEQAAALCKGPFLQDILALAFKVKNHLQRTANGSPPHDCTPSCIAEAPAFQNGVKATSKARKPTARAGAVGAAVSKNSVQVVDSAKHRILDMLSHVLKQISVQYAVLMLLSPRDVLRLGTCSRILCDVSTGQHLWREFNRKLRATAAHRKLLPRDRALLSPLHDYRLSCILDFFVHRHGRFPDPAEPFPPRPPKKRRLPPSQCFQIIFAADLSPKNIDRRKAFIANFYHACMADLLSDRERHSDGDVSA
jgi:hypothetical protein